MIATLHLGRKHSPHTLSGHCIVNVQVSLHGYLSFHLNLKRVILTVPYMFVLYTYLVAGVLRV